MKLGVLRVFWVGAALSYLAALIISGIGAWSLEHPTAENLRRGIQWDPDDPMLWRYMARTKLLSLDDGELQQGADAYRQVLARNPFDPLAWEGLATIESRLGDPPREEAVLRGWIAAIPHSPPAAWALANLLLQQGRSEEAFPLFRIAVTYDPSLRLPVFDLGWKLLGDPQRILEEMVPAELQARMDYLNFLVWKKGLVKEAYPVWEQILPARTEAVTKQGESYVEALAGAGFGADAERVWKELTWETGAAGTRSTDERITNGDFEAPLRNAGLDWRLAQGPGYQITLDNFQSQSGSRSLRVQFDGTANLEFSSVRQWVPVQPDTNYHFRAFLRTDNISTDNGIYLSLAPQAVPPAEYWEQVTENHVGTSPWSEQQLAFRTGPNTRVVQVILRRKTSTKLNNLLQGTVWLDHVSLQSPKN